MRRRRPVLWYQVVPNQMSKRRHRSVSLTGKTPPSSPHLSSLHLRSFLGSRPDALRPSANPFFSGPQHAGHALYLLRFAAEARDASERERAVFYTSATPRRQLSSGYNFRTECLLTAFIPEYPQRIITCSINLAVFATTRQWALVRRKHRT